MADRNHLHVCRHCGNVMATSSNTGPRACPICESEQFSLFLVLPELILEEPEVVQWRLYGEFARDVDEPAVAVAVGVEERDGERATVRDALEALLRELRTLRGRVLDDDGELRDDVVVMHNQVNVYNEPGHLDAPVAAGDELALFHRVA
jgi:molybdopterin converting factor small subunit